MSHDRSGLRARTQAWIRGSARRALGSAQDAERISALERELGALREKLTAAERRADSLDAYLRATSARGDDTAGLLRFRIGVAEAERASLHEGLTSVMARVPEAVNLDPDLEPLDVGLPGAVGYRAAPPAPAAGTYVAFEDRFRGTEEQIRDRQAVYVDLLRGRGPVLDLGCGRGEMLELLRDADVEAEGVDLDPAMIERCRSKGLDRVQVADAVGFLSELAPGGLGAVFAAQVVEHLTYDVLLDLLAAARRALNADGVLVLETVNPHNPQALKHFWIDPTHQHPLFPEVLLALCRSAGFATAVIWFPHGEGDADLDRRQQPDYTVVAGRGRLGRSGASAEA